METPDIVRIHEQQMQGHQSALNILRENERTFLKAQGILEAKEAAGAEISEIETDLQATKETLGDLNARKTAAINETTIGMQTVMQDVLPEHVSPIIHIDKDGVKIGMMIDNTLHPYAGLSGGEKVAFDGAIAKALRAGMIIYEAAEIDSTTLPKFMDKLDKLDIPVIVNTCHQPRHNDNSLYAPDGWNVVML